MSGLQDKNLLFYSNHPNDTASREILQLLSKDIGLKKQFIAISVNDPRIKIPQLIRQFNTVPVLIMNGFPKPILGEDAVSWLRNKDQANGYQYGSISQKDNGQYAQILSDEQATTDYHQFFNQDYNTGFKDSDNLLNDQFAKLTDDAHITTYDDSRELKKNISALLDQKVNSMIEERNKIGHGPPKVEGCPDYFNYSSGNRAGNGNQWTYNPNSSPQLPFQMPTRNGNSAPHLPFQMGRGQTTTGNAGLFDPHRSEGPKLPFPTGGRY